MGCTVDLTGMSQIPAVLHRRRLAVFLVVAFGFSWLVGAYVYVTGGLGAGATRPSSLTALLVVYMFGPALGHLAVRTLTDAPLSLDAAWVRPHLRRRLRWYLAAWFLPGLLTVLGVAIYYALFPQHFDPTMESLRGSLAGQLPAGTDTSVIIASQVVAAFTVGPAINTFVAFGEEFGWRGFLLQHLYPLGERRAVVISGVLWGVWHWPIIAMGYNYGTNYPAAPWLGMLVMVWVAILLGALLSWVTIRSGSVWPAALGHGAFNAVAAIGILFVAGRPNTLLGPMATGIVVAIPLLAVAAWLFARDGSFEPNPDTTITD